MVKVVIIAAVIAALFSAATDKVQGAEEGGVDPKQVVEGIKTGIEIAKQIADDITKVTAAITKVANIASQIASAFPYIGPALSLVTMFLPGQEDPVMKELKEGFKQLNERFDKIDEELKEIKNQILIGNSYEPYREAQDALDVLWSNYEKLQKDPKNQAYLTDMTDSCSKNDPNGKLVLIHKYVVEKGMGMDLLLAILKDSQYNNTKLTQLFGVVIRDATKAAFLRQACLGLRPGDNKNTMKQDADSAGKQIEAIYNALDSKKTEYRETLFKEGLVKDMNETMSAKKDSIMSISNAMHDILSTKYGFRPFTLVIYDTESAPNPMGSCQGITHSMYPEDSAKFQLQASDNTRHMYVIWSDNANAQKMQSLKDEAIAIIAPRKKSSINPSEESKLIYDALKDRKSVLVIRYTACTVYTVAPHSIGVPFSGAIAVVNY